MWAKYQQIALLNAKGVIHHLIPNKDLSSMKNMLHTEGKVTVGNNMCVFTRGESSRLEFTEVILTLVFFHILVQCNPYLFLG
jgi:hypothetical protein